MKETNTAKAKTGGIKRVVAVADNVRAEHWRGGKLVGRREVHNLLTTVGFTELALLSRGSGDAFTHIAIGEGTTPADIGDTTLESESMRDTATPGGSGADATFSTTFNIVATLAITESGVFNATPAGDMLCRAVFSALNVEDGDTIIITWTITFSA